VISRSSSFTYKGPGVDVGKVGHELAVRYVLEGSVRRAGNRVRISVDGENDARRVVRLRDALHDHQDVPVRVGIDGARAQRVRRETLIAIQLV
jgi:hypothetical protein